MKARKELRVISAKSAVCGNEEWNISCQKQLKCSANTNTKSEKIKNQEKIKRLKFEYKKRVRISNARAYIHRVHARLHLADHVRRRDELAVVLIHEHLLLRVQRPDVAHHVIVERNEVSESASVRVSARVLEQRGERVEECENIFW